jgi:hypothetical protein
MRLDDIDMDVPNCRQLARNDRRAAPRSNGMVLSRGDAMLMFIADAYCPACSTRAEHAPLRWARPTRQSCANRAASGGTIRTVCAAGLRWHEPCSIPLGEIS